MPDGTTLPSRRLLTAAEVAIRLGRTVGWFRRNRPELEERHGFPRPVDGCGMRWDPLALDRWLDARLPGAAAAPATTLQAAEARLLARAGM